MYFNECEGDETCHAHYGYPELCKPRVKARKEDAEADRWSWINRCHPDMYVVPSCSRPFNSNRILGTSKARASRHITVVDVTSGRREKQSKRG